MKWMELSVEALPEYVEPLSQVFSRYGQGGVAVEEAGGYNPDEGETPSGDERIVLRTYIPLNSASEERRNQIDLGVRLVAYFSPISVLKEKVVEEEDWQRLWKEHFQVLRIGQRIVIVPSWREYRPRDRDVVVGLDPGMAFGTGHHPTTRMCLELLEELVTPGMNILDVGCGSAILSIAAAGLGAGSVLGLEIDPVAEEVARSNLRDNGLDGKVRVALGSLPHADLDADGYDIAVANISAKVVSELAGEMVAAVRPGGTLIVPGILQDNADGVAQRLTEAGAHVGRRYTSGDWVSLVASVP